MLNRIRETHCEFRWTYFFVDKKLGMEERRGKRGEISISVYYMRIKLNKEKREHARRVEHYHGPEFESCKQIDERMMNCVHFSDLFMHDTIGQY